MMDSNDDRSNRNDFSFHFVEKGGYNRIEFYATPIENGCIPLFVNSDASADCSLKMTSRFNVLYVSQFIDALKKIHHDGIGAATLWGIPDEDYSLSISIEIQKFGGAKLTWQNSPEYSECQTISMYIQNIIDSEYMLQDILGFIEDLKSLIAPNNE